ncbi:MAG: SDR family NAD(P)-dependent oxidoreductase [Deltaproteobacteria bacterium]|nr:SDR family NAD(P)-dependent oxidoreductase [Deltaproteobacteria bacterium]
MKVVFVGATKGMGLALARKLAERGERLFLLGRDEGSLDATARDLEVRGATGSVGHGPLDLEDPDGFGPALDAASEALGGFDTLVITAGLFATQEDLEADPALAERLTRINFTNTVVLCEHAKQRLLDNGGGTLCVFSSVAGERGRKPVVIYGASKAGLSAYLEGLDHKHRADGLKVVTVKPGFVKTGMTAGLKPPPFAGEPDEVADIVVGAIDRGDPVVYAPGAWALVMAVIRRLPRAIMRRVGF